MKQSVHLKPALLLINCTGTAHYKITVMTSSFSSSLDNCHKTDLGTIWENLNVINLTPSNKNGLSTWFSWKGQPNEALNRIHSRDAETLLIYRKHRHQVQFSFNSTNYTDESRSTTGNRTHHRKATVHSVQLSPTKVTQILDEMSLLTSSCYSTQRESTQTRWCKYISSQLLLDEVVKK